MYYILWTTALGIQNWAMVPSTEAVIFIRDIMNTDIPNQDIVVFAQGTEMFKVKLQR